MIMINDNFSQGNIWFRPLELGVNKEAEFSSLFTNCNDVTQSGQVEYFQLSCKIVNIQ